MEYNYTCCYSIIILLSFVTVPSTLFKTRDQFPSVDEYSRYVKDNVCVGMSVLCCENCEDIRKGDTGKVTKVIDILHMYMYFTLWCFN